MNSMAIKVFGLLSQRVVSVGNWVEEWININGNERKRPNGKYNLIEDKAQHLVAAVVVATA